MDKGLTVGELATMLVDADRPEGKVQRRYLDTLSVQPEWQGLRLFAAAPALARELLALKRRLPDG